VTTRVGAEGNEGKTTMATTTCTVCGGPEADHGIMNGYHDKHDYQAKEPIHDDYRCANDGNGVCVWDGEPYDDSSFTYLDDPEFEWAIDPSSLVRTRALGDLIATLTDSRFIPDEVAQRLVLRGYAGLKARHPNATDEECLDTAIVWYTG